MQSTSTKAISAYLVWSFGASDICITDISVCVLCGGVIEWWQLKGELFVCVWLKIERRSVLRARALVDVHDVVGVVDPEDGVAGVPVEVVHGHAPRRPAHQRRQQRRDEDRGHDAGTCLTSAIPRHSGYTPVASQPTVTSTRVCEKSALFRTRYL